MRHPVQGILSNSIKIDRCQAIGYHKPIGDGKQRNRETEKQRNR